MFKNSILAGATVTALLAHVDTASAQVSVRAPFVRVDVGCGIYVRAPFVNLFIPTRTPIYVAPPIERVAPGFVAPIPAPLDASPKPVKPVKPMPRADDNSDDAPPPAAKASSGLTLDAFVKSFKPKAGSFEIELINPATNQPTTVRFTLPEGTPRRVHVSGREIEFDYGARRYVKIQFDSDGAVVITR